MMMITFFLRLLKLHHLYLRVLYVDRISVCLSVCMQRKVGEKFNIKKQELKKWFLMDKIFQKTLRKGEREREAYTIRPMEQKLCAKQPTNQPGISDHLRMRMVVVVVIIHPYSCMQACPLAVMRNSTIFTFCKLTFFCPLSHKKAYLYD